MVDETGAAPILGADSSGTQLDCQRYTAKNMISMKFLAERALKHYNKNWGANFKLKEVVLASPYHHHPGGKMHHMNFTAYSHSGVEELFFTEVQYKERETTEALVHGCCVLRRTEQEPDYHGERCFMCYEEPAVMHPGIRSGYEIFSGDQFHGAPFFVVREKEVPLVPDNRIFYVCGVRLGGPTD